jgi:hypothetical protein
MGEDMLPKRTAWEQPEGKKQPRQSRVWDTETSIQPREERTMIISVAGSAKVNGDEKSIGQ